MNSREMGFCPAPTYILSLVLSRLEGTRAFPVLICTCRAESRPSSMQGGRGCSSGNLDVELQ
jgi:hypothetical protein